MKSLNVIKQNEREVDVIIYLEEEPKNVASQLTPIPIGVEDDLQLYLTSIAIEYGLTLQLYKEQYSKKIVFNYIGSKKGIEKVMDNLKFWSKLKRTKIGRFYLPIILKIGCDKMLELEETIKILNELNEKLENLGESLWHS